MKKYILLLIGIGCFAACDDFDDLNTNVKDPGNVSGESLFTGAQKNLVDQMTSTSVNSNVFRLFAQHWTETTYPDESQYDLVNRSIPEQHWRVLYRDVLKDLDEATNVITATELLSTDDPVVKQNKLLVIETLKVYAYTVLVETFGNVPYEEALNIGNLSPKYDDGQAIYDDLLVRLDVAIGQFDESKGSFSDKEDNIYNGDVAQWIKFANSLKLRMGMLYADMDAVKAGKIAQEALTSGVFAGNEDNASMPYLATTPNTNPVYASLVLSGRDDFVPANTLVEIMQPREYEGDGETIVPGSVKYTDPRAKYYFMDNLDADSSVPETVYLGGIYGVRNVFSKFSRIGHALHTPQFSGTLMDYAEVEFLLAEAVERGYIAGDAEEHYNKAIVASVEFWGGTAAEATDYLALPEIAYTTATGDFKQKIGMQKWIALYNRGFTAWREWRRLDYPKLEPSEEAISPIPVRYTYPIVEQTLNGASWSVASSAIGGDRVTTRLFWDME